MSEISQKQLEANRQNAKLGGVKTEEGKAVSKYNAVKHGLLSEKVLMKNESMEKLEEFWQKLRKDFKPQSEIELLLVDRIVTGFWRLSRLLALEEESTRNDYGSGLDKNADLFFRYETMLERSIYKALHELQRLQAVRNGEKLPAPVAVDIDISKE